MLLSNRPNMDEVVSYLTIKWHIKERTLYSAVDEYERGLLALGSA